jgi:hypothetical protein
MVQPPFGGTSQRPNLWGFLVVNVNHDQRFAPSNRVVQGRIIRKT